MALTITKFPNGYFLFESNTRKHGSSHPRLKQIDDTLGFFQWDGAVIEGYLPYTEISLFNEETEVTDFDSAETLADALKGLGFTAMELTV